MQFCSSYTECLSEACHSLPWMLLWSFESFASLKAKSSGPRFSEADSPLNCFVMSLSLLLLSPKDILLHLEKQQAADLLGDWAVSPGVAHPHSITAPFITSILDSCSLGSGLSGSPWERRQAAVVEFGRISCMALHSFFNFSHDLLPPGWLSMETRAGPLPRKAARPPICAVLESEAHPLCCRIILQLSTLETGAQGKRRSFSPGNADAVKSMDCSPHASFSSKNETC